MEQPQKTFVMFPKGELNEDQSHFMAAQKPEFELYDMVNDPFELHNLANDADFQKIKNELLAELSAWRKSVNDPGVSDAFRAGGWSAEYPTKTREAWEERRAAFVPWLFREPSAKMKVPGSNW